MASKKKQKEIEKKIARKKMMINALLIAIAIAGAANLVLDQ